MTTQPANTASADDLAAIAAQLRTMQAQIDLLVARQRKTDELFEELGPILRAVVQSSTERLDALEKKGYFAFGRESLRVVERVVEGFSSDDVRQLGDAVVSILETVRALTQPEVLRVASEASDVLQNADRAEPIGLFGMVRATNDHDVQKGMSVMLELMRHVGRATQLVRERRASPMADKRAKLDAITGARRSRALGVERAPASPTARVTPPGAPRPAACAVSAAPKAVATTLDGVGYSADGHLVDASTWTRELALSIAALQGVELTDAHWRLVDLARADFEATKAAPNIRRLTQLANVDTKSIYALFPKAPARTLAKIAGLPKPAGCL